MAGFKSKCENIMDLKKHPYIVIAILCLFACGVVYLMGFLFYLTMSYEPGGSYFKLRLKEFNNNMLFVFAIMMSVMLFMVTFIKIGKRFELRKKNLR